MEAKNLTLAKSIDLFKEDESIVHNTKGEIRMSLKRKFETILRRNPDFIINLKVNAEDLKICRQSNLFPITIS